MGEACFVIPTCQRPDGTHVESKLFEDLWKASGNYEWAEEQYKIATDQNFLDSVSIEAVFDNNGQITAKSFMDITGVTFSSDEIKKRLSERWEDKRLPTEEVPSRVADFNNSEELKDDFVPVIEDEGEVVKFTISQRTPERIAELQSFIEHHELLNVISKRLKDLGVAYDFVGEKERYSGRFSTRNAEKAFDGLYHLIEIADGAKVEDALVEESAHLATLACKDSVFINRLLNAINENTVNSLFTREELEGVDLGSREAKLELAGKLVAKAMRNEATRYNSLLGNIKRMFSRVFSGSNLASLLSAKARAKNMAERLARGFLYDENMDVEEALKTPTTLYLSKPITKEGEKLKEVLNHIKKLGARVRTFSSVAYNDVYRKLSERAVLGDDDYNTITTEETVGHMTAAVDVLLERLGLLAAPLAQIDEKFFDEELSTDSINMVYEADSILHTLVGENDDAGILASLEQLGINPDELEASSLREIDRTIHNIEEACKQYKDSIENYKFLFAVHMMREVCGSENIDLAADVCFSGLKAKARGARHYSVRDIVKFYNDELTDTSGILTYFRTYSNHKDITTQVFYNIVRRAKAKEAIDYNGRITELIEIEKQWKEYLRTHKNASTLDLFEWLDDGSLTGYFRSDIRHGQFARDKKDVIKEVKQVFLRELKSGLLNTQDGAIDLSLADFKRMTKSQRYNLFNEYLEQHPYYQRFMDEAYLDRDSGTLSDKYVDHGFTDYLMKDPEFKEIYDRILKYKSTIDAECLTDISEAGGGKCHGVAMRVPQFKAGLIRKIFINNKLIENKDLYDYRHTQEICEDVTSDYFGSPITEEVALEGEETGDPLDLRRLALYGINMLETPNDVSTDIFKTLELYTEMASRFHTSQEVASRLELFHSKLNERKAAGDVSLRKKGENRVRNAKRISANKRENILRNFVYAKTHTFSFKDGSWKSYLAELGMKVGGTIGAFAAIRALCFAPIAGIKNYIAGYRVFAQDVKAGVLEDVTMKDVIKATWVNMAPKHFIGEIGRVLFGETMSFDHYQKLIDRWDSYRTPSKIHRKKGFHPLQTLVNIAMANYSTTDNALVGTIYYSKLNKVMLYDVNNHEFVSAANAYRWVKDNPIIKEGLLLDANSKDEYNALKAAIESVQDIIANNKVAEDDVNVEIMRLSDSVALGNLEDFYDYSGRNLPAIKNPDGTYKDAEVVLAALQKASRDLCYSDETEFKLCSNINDYIISSQGVYGMLNATEFQSGVYTQSLGKIKGYMFGLMQRNFFSNYRMTNQKMNHSVMGSVALALWSIFAGAKEISAMDDITPTQYRLYSAYFCFLPFAMRSKECVKHMQRCGWDPDQLAKLSSFAIGFWINLALSLLSRMLYRGNERAIGEKVYRNKGKTPLDKAALEGAISMFTSDRYQKLIEPGILFPESGKTIDYAKAYEQMEKWEKSGYRKNQRDESLGYFSPGTKEFADREQSYILRNISYNTQDPMYYMTGAFYRLTRGIRDEGVTLMNPVRFANDVIEMVNFGNSIAVSGGLMVLVKGVTSLMGNQDMRESWLDREINFYLGKMGFTYDSTPDAGNPKVQMIDWYGKQDKIDRYQEQERALPQLWN